MNTSTIASLLLACASLAGCCTTGLNRPPPPTTSVTTVLDMVKDELNAYLATPSTATPNSGPCHKEGGPIDVKPVKITATLKAVRKQENDPGVGLKAPLGIFSIDPSYSGAYSKASTQTIVVPLMVPDKQDPQPIAPGDHEIAAALALFRDQIVMVDHAKTPCLEFVDAGSFKVSIVFDVVNQSTGGVSLQLAFLKLSDKQISTDELHQTLDIELALTTPGALRRLLEQRIQVPPAFR